MSEKFDPYQAWLEIRPEHQPPNYYRLLGLELFEDDIEAIENAVLERTGSLHAFESGEHGRECRKLLDEISAAKACLTNPGRRAAYDKGLRRVMGSEAGQPAEQSEAGKAPQKQAPPAINSEEFLAVLEEKDLLPTKLLESLRKQVAGSKKPIPAATVANRLIEGGYLTPPLARRLLAAGGQPPSAAAAAAQPAAEPKETAEPEEDDLGLAPLEDEPARKSPAKQKPRPAAEPQKPPAGQTPREQTSTEQAAQPAAAPAGSGSLLDQELQPLGADTGPLDGMLADAGLDAAAAARGSPLAPVAKKKGLWRQLFGPKKKKWPGRKDNVWDSPLLLIGGGALLALLIIGSALIWVLGQESGDEMFALAMEDYRSGSYTNAIHKFNRYLEKCPNHARVSAARVKREMARLWQAAEGTRNWPSALEIAKEVIEKTSSEKDFNTEGRPELASLLPNIAEGLAAQAQQTSDPKLVEQARETLDLIVKYLSTDDRNNVRMGEIEASLALTTHQINRGDDLVEAIGKIKKAISSGDTQQAYAIRKTLLKRHPSLTEDEKLTAVVLEISRAQQAAVKWVEKQRSPVPDEPAARFSASLTLAQREMTAEAPGADGRSVFAMTGGAAYALDAATGKVLWRRFLGFGSNGRSLGFAPLPIAAAAESDVLLVDADDNALLRVEASTGRTRWRYAVGEPFDAHPVLSGDRILVATSAGRLVLIDAASGQSPGHVQLPQPLPVAPAVDSRRGLIFLPADHSNLFVLNLADGACREVVYLGHEAGSVTAAPVAVSSFVLLAVNDRSRDALLQVLTIGEGQDPNSPLLAPVQMIRLTGHVDTPPLAIGRRAVLATDLGAAYVFELSGTDLETPLRIAASTPTSGAENLVRFCLTEGANFWVGGQRLVKYDIQATRGRLVPRGVGDEQSVFLQPLVAIGRTIFHVRRKVGMPGVIVSAVSMDGSKPYWRTRLAAPLVGEPIVDRTGGKITAVTALGGLFRVDAAGMKGEALVDGPEVFSPPGMLRRPVTEVVRLGGGALALSGAAGSEKIAVFDPDNQKSQYRWLSVPEGLGGPPVALAGGLLAPSKAGGLFLVEPLSGARKTEPFQPRMQSGVQLAWRRPALLENDQALLADGHSMLYRVGVKPDPKPHLAALAEREISEPIVSPVAVLGQVAYAVDAAGVLNTFQLPKLTAGPQRSLSGRCVWGPQRVGDLLMLATEDDQLLCLDAAGKVLWEVPLPYGPLAGPPLPVDDHLVLVSQSGVVWRADVANGAELGKIETGRPMATGPAPLGKQLLIGGYDGSLYRVERP